jgi:hypothetical protein
MAARLRVLMPANYSGPPLTLYRGASQPRAPAPSLWFLLDHRCCHCPQVCGELRASRAQLGRRSAADAGVAEAILLVREPEDYFEEGEVVVDPYRLGKVRLLERLTQQDLSTDG